MKEVAYSVSYNDISFVSWKLIASASAFTKHLFWDTPRTLEKRSIPTATLIVGAGILWPIRGENMTFLEGSLNLFKF